MNKLETAHENDPMVFIHITDEKEAEVARFLKKRPIRGWIGIDTQRETFKNYGVKALPTVAVIGKDGIFLGWNDPRVLTNEPEILQDVLGKGSSERLWGSVGTLEDPLDGVARATTKGAANLCDIVIRPSNRDSARRSGGRTFDRPLVDHLASHCGVHSTRIIDTDKLLDDHYDIIAITKNVRAPAMQEALCQLITATFDLSLVREKRVMDVYLLKTLPGREPTLNRSQGALYTDDKTRTVAPNKELLERMKNGENYFSVPTKLAWLAGNVALTLKKPVITDLGDLPEKADGVYWFCFPYPRGNVEAFRRAFEKNVGLTLVPARREVEVLVVSSAGQPSGHSQD